MDTTPYPGWNTTTRPSLSAWASSRRRSGVIPRACPASFKTSSTLNARFRSSGSRPVSSYAARRSQTSLFICPYRWGLKHVLPSADLLVNRSMSVLLLAVPLPCGAKFVQVLYCRIPLPLHLLQLGLLLL
jgi:hypothetical protein